MPPASTEGLSDIEIDIAPGASPAAAGSDLTWVRAGSRRTEAALVITGGRDDEASTVEAGSLSAIMDDRDGNLSPRNPTGTWYGELGRGTPVRIRWDRLTDDFARTVSPGWGTTSSGFAWSSINPSYLSTDGSKGIAAMTSGQAHWSILTGAGSPDVEVSWSVTLPVLPTGANFVSAALLRYTASYDCLRAHVELSPGGNIAVKIVRATLAGTVTLFDTTNVGTYTAGAVVRGRARADGPYLMVKGWLASGAEPAAWQGTATDNVCEGVDVGVFQWRLNTNAGTFTSYMDNLSVTNVLWTGNVPEWPPRWPDKSGADSTMALAGAGIFRRLLQGVSPLQSPLRRQLSGLSYAQGYWPLEDGTGATSAASGLSRGSPAQVIGEVSFASEDTLPGADSVVVLAIAGESSILGSARGPATTGYAVMAFFRCTAVAAPASETLLLDIRATGTVTRWTIEASLTTVRFTGYDADGTNIIGSSSTWGDGDPMQWMSVQLETQVSAGTITATLLWNRVGTTTFNFLSDTVAGSATRVTQARIYAIQDEMAAAHLWIGDDALPYVDTTFLNVSNGWAGETVAARITRLCAETGTPVMVLSGATEKMGRQRVDTLINLLRECERTDQGVLFERGNAIAYRPRTRRYNSTVALALDWSLGHLAEPPEPQDDDQRLRNQWTVNRVGGSSATASDEDGPNGVNVVGLYDDQVELNLSSDDRLIDFATWLVNLGTEDSLRWPRITIDLIAHPELISAWLGCSIGSRVTVANPPSQIRGQVIDLIVEGFTQSINVDKWEVELSCSPAAPWSVGEYSDTAKRYDSRTTTLQAGINSTATSFTLTFTNQADRWSRQAASQPYDLMIAGERITVPVGGMGAVTGSGPYTQAVTGATRSVNGVVKALTAGSTVRVATPGRYAL